MNPITKAWKEYRKKDLEDALAYHKQMALDLELKLEKLKRELGN